MITAVANCPCGSPADVAHHPAQNKDWSVRCMKNRGGNPVCRRSRTQYSSREDLAIGLWNAQFRPSIEVDDSPRCRCGLRVDKPGDSCNDCIKPVQFYARSGQSTYGAEQPRMR